MSGETTKSYNGTNDVVDVVDENHADALIYNVNEFRTEKQQPYVKFYHYGMDKESYLVCSVSLIPQSQFNLLPSYHEIEETKGCGKTYDCVNFKSSNLGRLLR